MTVKRSVMTDNYFSEGIGYIYMLSVKVNFGASWSPSEGQMQKVLLTTMWEVFLWVKLWALISWLYHCIKHFTEPELQGWFFGAVSYYGFRGPSVWNYSKAQHLLVNQE